MDKVFVIGHKNPDTDAVCAPYCYAWLKNHIDKSHDFIPGVLGNLSTQTRYIFDSLSIQPPELIRDVYPKAEDVMLKSLHTIHEDAPIGLATQLIDQRKVRTIPLVNNNGDYCGLVTMLELADYFMPKHYESRPLYNLRPENFGKVVPGKYLKRGTLEEIEAPLMVSAMAFDTFIKRLNDSLKHTCQPVLIAGNRRDILEYSLQQQFPAIIITGMEPDECQDLDISHYHGWIYVSSVDTAETIRMLRTSIPAKAIANKTVPVIRPDAYLSDVKRTLMNLDYHGIAVLDDSKLVGLVTSSCLIDPPKHKVIMIDHNETNQSVEGIEDADIIEIIDHHRLGSIKTTKPIYVYARPLGSSCTLVFQHFQMNEIDPPPAIASLLLSGILTDTIILRSPTTTPEDILAAKILSRISGLDIPEWGKDIFQHAASLAGTNPDEAVAGDFKVYTEYGYRVGISQMEVVTLSDLDQFGDAYLEAVSSAKQKYSLDWAMLLVTDIINEESILLTSDLPLADGIMRFHKRSSNTWELPNVLSRKKQLLPEVLRVLEQLPR